MFSDYELIEFSNKMCEIRNNLGYSRDAVSALTGINVDTIRKIEKGISIPRFDTLEILSHLYKIDLIQVLNNYKSNSSITYYYESINTSIINQDIPRLLETYADFLQWLNTSNDCILVNPSELRQLKMFFKTLYLRYSEQHFSINELTNELVAALRTSIPSFDLSNWKCFNYNTIELRILYCIASFLLQSNNYFQSNDILEFLLDKVEIANSSKQNSNTMLVKLYTLLSYNYHMLDLNHEALQAAENGILLCQKINTMENLPLLLSRKGVALYKLNQPNYHIYLNQAITLLEIQGNNSLAEKYRNINKSYGVE